MLEDELVVVLVENLTEFVALLVEGLGRGDGTFGEAVAEVEEELGEDGGFDYLLVSLVQQPAVVQHRQPHLITHLLSPHPPLPPYIPTTRHTTLRRLIPRLFQSHLPTLILCQQLPHIGKVYQLEYIWSLTLIDCQTCLDQLTKLGGNRGEEFGWVEDVGFELLVGCATLEGGLAVEELVEHDAE